MINQTPNLVATDAAAPDPIAHTEAVTVKAIPIQPTPQQHASRLHSILRALEGLLAIGTSPEVMKLLPPKFQAIVAVASVVDQAVGDPPPQGSP